MTRPTKLTLDDCISLARQIENWGILDPDTFRARGYRGTIAGVVVELNQNYPGKPVTIDVWSYPISISPNYRQQDGEHEKRRLRKLYSDVKRKYESGLKQHQTDLPFSDKQARQAVAEIKRFLGRK